MESQQKNISELRKKVHNMLYQLESDVCVWKTVHVSSYGQGFFFFFPM
jgi:hypothetical protein